MTDRFPGDDRPNRTTIIERRSGSGGLMVTLIILIALVAAIAYFLFAQESRQQSRSDAVIGAAERVGDAARDAGTAIGDVADRAAPRN